MQPQSINPVKLVICVLFSDEQLLNNAKCDLIRCYGEIDFESAVFDFNTSYYYYTEMGSPLFRVFYSHKRLIQPDEIARIKIECNRLEMTYAVQNNRKVNLDPGYLDYDKFVLASAKYNGQKIYLDLGIYADITLHYQKGHFVPYPWSFPDFKSGIYENSFLAIRTKYKSQLKLRNS